MLILPVSAAHGESEVLNLCWEANVVPFQTASLLASANQPVDHEPAIVRFGCNIHDRNPYLLGIRGTVQGPNGWFFMCRSIRVLVNS